MGLVGSPSMGANWQCPRRGTWEVKPCWLMGSVVQGGTQVASTEVRAWEGSHGKGKHNQEQGRTWWGDQGVVSLGGPINSPGSRSGLSPDRGYRETPGVSCPGPPTFRSREGPPRPPFRSVRPGFSAGETVREKGGN